jgi:multidrug efflux pump subunit AcrB
LGIDKLDGDKVILISADKENDVVLSDITAQIDKIFAENPMPSSMSYKPAADIQTQTDTARDLGISMVVGIIMMYLVLILQFNNIKYATVIITSVFLTI